MEEIWEEQESGGLHPITFYRTTPSRTSENAPFQTRIWLVLIIATYVEEEKLIPHADFIEFCRSELETEKLRRLLLLAVDCL